MVCHTYPLTELSCYRTEPLLRLAYFRLVWTHSDPFYFLTARTHHFWLHLRLAIHPEAVWIFEPFRLGASTYGSSMPQCPVPPPPPNPGASATQIPGANGQLFVGARVQTQFTVAEGGDNGWYSTPDPKH